MSFHPLTGTSLGVSAARPRSRSVSAVRSASPPLSDSSSFFAPGSGLLPLSVTRRLWSETGLGSSPDLTRLRPEATRTNASPIRSVPPPYWHEQHGDPGPCRLMGWTGCSPSRLRRLRDHRGSCDGPAAPLAV